MNLVWPVLGESRGTAVLLHGAMASASTWWHVGPTLATFGWHTVAVDLPGHGDAPPHSGAFTLGTFAAQTAERMPPSVDLLVGHSLGAVVALTMANELGFGRALVLEDPPDNNPDNLVQMARGISADADLVVRDRDALIRRTRAVNPMWAEQDVLYAVDGIASADAEGFLAALATRPQWDLPNLVAAASRPVCVLAPLDGALTEARPALRKLVSAQNFVEVKSGHCMHRARPDQWILSVRRFADAALPARGYLDGSKPCRS